MDVLTLQSSLEDQDECAKEPTSPIKDTLHSLNAPQVDAIDYDENNQDNQKDSDEVEVGFDHGNVQINELTNVTNNELDDLNRTMSGNLIPASDIEKHSFMENKDDKEEQENNTERVSIPVEVNNTQEKKTIRQSNHYVCLAEFQEIIKLNSKKEQSKNNTNSSIHHQYNGLAFTNLEYLVKQDESLPRNDNHNKKNEDVNNNLINESERKVSKVNAIEITIDRPIVVEPTHVYYYTNTTRYTEIFLNRKLTAQPMFYSNRLLNGIILLLTPPTESDEKLLKNIYGECVPVDRSAVQCFIQLRLNMLYKYGMRGNETSSNNKPQCSSVIKINDDKYVCLRSIKFDQKLPKHDFRFSS